MKVLCKLPNASGEINGVKFSDHPAGKISDDLSDDAAAQFLSIPGYEACDDRPPSVPDWEAKLSDEERAELARLRDRGVALKIVNAQKMGAPRLRDEIAAAEKSSGAAS